MWRGREERERRRKSEGEKGIRRGRTGEERKRGGRKGRGTLKTSEHIYSLGIVPGALCALITPGDMYATDKETEALRGENIGSKVT